MSLVYPYDKVEFQKKYDLPVRLVASANRYKELKQKEYLTGEENEELNLLATTLADYIITAEDYNKVFTTVNNMQTYVADTITDHLNIFLNTHLESTYFEFDNFIYRSGFKYKREFINETPVRWEETIINIGTEEVYATRVSEKTDTGWKITTKCPALSINVVDTETKIAKGQWEGVITDGI